MTSARTASGIALGRGPDAGAAGAQLDQHVAVLEWLHPVRLDADQLTVTLDEGPRPRHITAAEHPGRHHLIAVGATGRHARRTAQVDRPPVDAAAAAPAARPHEVGDHLELEDLPREPDLGLLDVAAHHRAQATERRRTGGAVIAGHGAGAAVVVERGADVGTARSGGRSPMCSRRGAYPTRPSPVPAAPSRAPRSPPR